MKNQLKSITGLYALSSMLLVLFSCENPLEKMNSESLYGTVRLQFDVSVDIIEKHGRMAAVNTDDFIVKFLTAGGVLYKSFDRYADMGTEVSLEPGTYYVSVQSSTVPVIAFDSPWYYGESDLFSIDYEESKTIQIEAVLANCLFSVVYSPEVIDQFTDYSTTLTSSEGSLVFTGDEIRMGYFPVLPIAIESSLIFINPDGTNGLKMVNGDIADPLPGYHYEIHIEASLDSGSSILDILVDETVTTEIVSLGNGTSSLIEGPVGYGDLIITEIMYNPAALSDTEGEWFEIFNASTETIDLFQLVIKEGSEVQHIISEPLSISPQDFIVLAKTAGAAVTASYVYGSALTLTNTGQEITLSNYGDDGSNGSVISTVNYGAAGFPDGNGASIILDPLSYDADAAQSGANWCLSTSAFETGDLGTPGADNDACQ